jgi:hypothetical protein
MLVIAFLSFALLMVMMMMAPMGEAKKAAVAVPALRVGEAPA